MAALRNLAAYYGVSPAMAAVPNFYDFNNYLRYGTQPGGGYQSYSLVYPGNATSVDEFINRLFQTGIWNNTGPVQTVQTTGFDDRGCILKQVNDKYNVSDLALFSPGTGILFPGAVFQGQYMNLGIGMMTPIDVPYTKRNPVPLVSNYSQMGAPFQTATSPTATATDVYPTIGQMFNAITNQTAFVPSTKPHFESKYVNSVDEMASSLKVDVNALGGKFSAAFSTSSSTTRSTVFVHFLQTWLTVALDRKGMRPSQFLFNNNLTVQDLEYLGNLGQLGYDPVQPLNNNLPTYIGSVTYGREFIFTLTSSVSRSKLEAAVSAVFKDYGIHATLEQQQIIQNSNINILSIGGPRELTEAAIRSGEWKDYFKEGVQIPYSTLEPLSFEVWRWDGQRAAMGRTTNYQTRECPGHKVEVRVSNILKRAVIRLFNAQDGLTSEIVSTTSDSGWIDISSKMSGPDDEIHMDNQVTQTAFLGPYWRRAQLEIRIDGQVVVGPGKTTDMDGFDRCYYCHSASPALTYKMNGTGNGVYLRYRN